MKLEIIYQDEQLEAINKPHGLLVHRTNIATDVSEFALQLLRDQLGKHVYPCHRLDRKTSSVLLFALDEESKISIIASPSLEFLRTVKFLNFNSGLL
ncbi:MAG: hypothetical protein K8R74_00770 [Bacteroidales bacterium]|nr:hypothetical protein [Bacteroidales bacterium]